MLSKKSLIAAAAVVLALITLVPQSQIAQENALNTDKVSPVVREMVNQAAPEELVTVIVRMADQANFQGIEGQRGPVFAALRQTAAQSQAQLVNSLRTADKTNKVGVIRQFWIDNLVLVQATRDVITEIANRRDVLHVFENYTFTLPPRPNARSTDGPQGAAMQTQTQLWDHVGHIGAKDVWNQYGFTGGGIRVGGLDTGVDINHPDLAGKMVTNNPADPTYPGGWAEFDGNGNPIPGSVPHDSDEHGTHTSGTMVGGNASGYDIGVAPGANLMHGLVIPGGSGSFAQVAGGMEWIIDPDGNPMTDDGADVVNMSLGATGTYDAMVVPTDNMVAANVFPSFSIGNSGPASNTTGSPGNVPSAFGVGATDSLDVIASFSSRGPVTWNTPPYVGTYIKPDMSAPGVKVYSTVPGGDWQWTSPLGDWSGTSMAAPHLSGSVALIRQANPTLSVADIKQLLAQTAVDLGTAGKDNTYGYGRVNTYAAVTAALAGIGTLEGTVTSSAGGPVQYAEVLITDSGQKVYTDEFGHYSFQVVADDHTVQYSAFGYETQSVLVTIVADATTTQDVTLTQLPSGEVAGTVYDSDTMAGVGCDIEVLLGGDVVKLGSSDPSTGAYSITLPIGTYDLRFNPPFPYPTHAEVGVAITEGAITALDVALMPAQILIVDDDGGDGYETYFEQAVLGAGRSYLTVSTPPTAAEMASFESVVWFTGDDYTTTLTSADQAELAAFLDGGGRLFITGQDIGYDIRTESFYGDYLHATYVADDVGLGAVIGDPTNPVGFGFAFDIQGGSGANNQGYPSEVDPISPALRAFMYDEGTTAAATTTNRVEKNSVEANAITSSGTAGLTFDNGVYRLVYFSFGFEAIADAGTRSAVMDRILDWLQGYPEIAHDPLGDTEDTEQPYEVTAFITSDYFPLDPSTFAVVYDAGSGPMSVPMTATGTPDEYRGYIPAQPAETLVQYYISAADIEGHTSTHPVGAPLNQHMFNVARDQIPPDVSHIRHSDTNDLTGPYYIKATATDNIGIEAVYLIYWKNNEMAHRIKMMPMNGEYVGEIPGPSEVGDIYNYYILAMDDSYSGNATRVPESGSYAFEIVEEFVWDFEQDDGYFTQTGDVWEWGTPTYGPDGAHSGVNVWGTVLDGNYPNYMDATLDIPQITLDANKPYALFSFWHWYYMETNYDGGNVKISTDGGSTWDIVTPVGGYNGTGRSGNAGVPGEPIFTGYNDDYWHEVQFDLSAYAGQSIMLRFHAGSDGSVQRDGWYIDDVRLRSASTDDVAPTIANVDVPLSTFDTSGPYEVTAEVSDLFSGVDVVTLYYSTDNGGTWTSVAMTNTSGVEYSGDIPGQPQGTRIKLYIGATDLAGNPSTSPAGAPADTYGFSILPSASILVMVSSSSTGASLDDFRQALEAYGYEADYWNLSSQGSTGILPYLNLYDKIILDERSSMSTTEKTAYSDFLNSGTVSDKKGFFLLAYNVSYYSSNRPWVQEFMRADYVQSDPAWREITGEPGDPIGIGETFVIDGYSPDEVQRSDAYPGGEIVYRFTGEGAAAKTRDDIAGWHEKEGLEWDGVMPHAPKSLDAAAGMRYNGGTYRSVYLTFAFDYILESQRQADITDRVIRWIDSPEIVHTPLSDSEDTLSVHTVTAQVYSADLDPSRVNLVYDAGEGDVTLLMIPTGNPDEYSADIPPQSLGTTVNYYISAANTDGNTSYHPVGAPTDRHSFEVTADITPPVIVHVPLGTTADVVGPYTISADVTDNVGVDPAGVSLTWRKNGGTTTTTAMAHVSGDTYAADIPGPGAIGDVFEYYIRARDIAAVPNTARDPATGFHSLEIVDYYAWDFESSDGGFAATGPDWEWGTATAGPDTAHSGVNLWATKLGSDYTSPSDSRLETALLVVPTSSMYAQLSYWQWYYIETNYDGGNVKISTDGGTSWTILTPDIGYNGTARTTNAGIPGEPCFTGTTAGRFWHKVTFNLTPYRGQTVMIRWHFGSDSSVDYAGWFIDDVRIESVDDTEGPTFVSVDIPDNTYDETGPYTASATVLDALSGVANVTLNYSTDDGGSWTGVTMTPTGNPDEYSGDIPGQPAGTRVKLYFGATDNASNGTTDPSDAPTSTYEFGVAAPADYLVIFGGYSHTDPSLYQAAFSAIGRSVDFWDWEDLGVPTAEMLESYEAVIIDDSGYLDSSQQAVVGPWLDQDDGTPQRIFFLGRDLSYYSTGRSFMEQYTGTAYVQDNPSWYQLSSTPGDPIGNDETFVISGSYPDEVQLSTTYTGGDVVYRYSGTGSTLNVFETEDEAREFYQKSGKDWDPRMYPFAPAGPDSAAGVRYIGPHHVSVYFTFELSYIQEDWRRAGIIDRALTWIVGAAKTDLAMNRSEAQTTTPERLQMDQNYPNPFNPTTTIRVGVPEGATGDVSLKIYNVRGQLVRTLFHGNKAPGWYTFVWDGRDNKGVTVSTGVYFSRFDDTQTVLTRKMVLLK